MTDFTVSATVDAPYAETVTRVRELLADAGFGVLTEIDLAATLKAKLDVDVPPQVILGACRPELAHRALVADERVATMLPCNVVVSDTTTGKTKVEVFDPAVMHSFSNASDLINVGHEARERLQGMLDRLEGRA